MLSQLGRRKTAGLILGALPTRLRNTGQLALDLDPEMSVGAFPVPAKTAGQIRRIVDTGPVGMLVRASVKKIAPDMPLFRAHKIAGQVLADLSVAGSLTTDGRMVPIRVSVLGINPNARLDETVHWSQTCDVRNRCGGAKANDSTWPVLSCRQAWHRQLTPKSKI